MTRAWLEIDRLGVEHTSALGVWERMQLDEEQPVMLSVFDRHVTLARGRIPASQNLVDVFYARNRWMLQPRVHDVYRNGVQLQNGERYPLDNGDRIEALRGTWLRFLDDTVVLPLPRLRQVGRAFLFAPSPADGANRWRAMLTGREELFFAELVSTADEDAVRDAFPFVVDVVTTPRGPYAVSLATAGISLASLLARTREQDAALDDVALDEVRARCLAALEHARLAGWQRTQVFAENVIVTWEGRVVWLGFTEPGREPVSLGGARMIEAIEEGGEGARTLAGVVAQLFPEEHAAEMSLREEVTLWTRDGLADLERATRGRPSP